MIASLTGHIQTKNAGSIVLEVHGVGYELVVSGRTLDKLPKIGETCFLLVHTALREDSLTLYGFFDQEEKDIFLLLIRVGGIGPKLALTVLSGIGCEELRQAVIRENIDRLTALPGIGKKTAQRICMELGEKMGAMESFSLAGKASGGTAAVQADSEINDAISALINLGYPRKLACQALQAVLPEHQEDTLHIENVIRAALQWLNSPQKQQRKTRA